MELCAPSTGRQEKYARHGKAFTLAALAGKTTSPPPSTKPDMVDVALHLAAQRSKKLCTR
jgi:hypothetical protein